MKYVIFIRFSVAQTSSFLEEQPGKGHGRRPERTLQANAILRRINGKARAGASPAPTIHEPEKLIRRIVGAIPCDRPAGLHSLCHSPAKSKGPPSHTSPHSPLRS